MKSIIFALLISMVMPQFAQSQQKSISDTTIVGIWKGTSICQIQNSPCHDEIVVYYISKAKGKDRFSISASKIVNGKEEDMGVLECVLNRSDSKLISNSYNSLWTFVISGNNLDGTLIHKEQLYRKIKLQKSH